jgi:hypothetical protein
MDTVNNDDTCNPNPNPNPSTAALLGIVSASEGWPHPGPGEGVSWPYATSVGVSVRLCTAPFQRCAFSQRGRQYANFPHNVMVLHRKPCLKCPLPGLSGTRSGAGLSGFTASLGYFLFQFCRFIQRLPEQSALTVLITPPAPQRYGHTHTSRTSPEILSSISLL